MLHFLYLNKHKAQTGNWEAQTGNLWRSIGR